MLSIRRHQQSKTMRYYCIPIRWLKLKKKKRQQLIIPNVGRNIEQQENSFTAARNAKWYNHFGRQSGSFLQTLNKQSYQRTLVAHLVKNLPAMQELTCNARESGLIPGLGRSPREGNGHPLQSSCLGNLMDRGAWQAIVHGITRVGHDLATNHNHQTPSYHISQHLPKLSCKNSHTDEQQLCYNFPKLKAPKMSSKAEWVTNCNTLINGILPSYKTK